MRERPISRPKIWQPRGPVVRTFDSHLSLRSFNDQVMIPVAMQALRSSEIKIDLVSSQSEMFSFWELKTVDRYARRPTAEFDIITVNFTLAGTTNYIFRGGTAAALPGMAVLASHQNLLDAQASELFSVFGAAISSPALMRINEAFTGEPAPAPPFARTADMAAPAIRALYCTMRRIHERSLALEQPGDLTFALMQEIVGYQLLAAWPRQAEVAQVPAPGRPSRLSLAKDYIHASLAAPLTLSDIAEAAGLSVRALQDNFRRSVNQTPFQYITHQRLMRVHDDLTTPSGGDVSVGDIARRWGFVHMSDFGQRYRRLYGCTPTETRHQAGGRVREFDHRRDPAPALRV